LSPKTKNDAFVFTDAKKTIPQKSHPRQPFNRLNYTIEKMTPKAVNSRVPKERQRTAESCLRCAPQGHGVPCPIKPSFGETVIW
jgi:hypothetical protein